MDHLIPSGFNPGQMLITPDLATTTGDASTPSGSATVAASGAGSSSSAATAMEDGKDPKKTDSSKQQPYSLPPLSLLLDLEKLWNTLSECLDVLEKTYDPHAVLVLQPTVESFFLVHGELSEETKTANTSTISERRSQSTSRSRRLPSFHTISDTESIPGSPAPFIELSPSTPSATETEDPYAHLSPDTMRFLKFAGELMLSTCVYMFVCASTAP